MLPCLYTTCPVYGRSFQGIFSSSKTTSHDRTSLAKQIGPTVVLHDEHFTEWAKCPRMWTNSYYQAIDRPPSFNVKIHIRSLESTPYEASIV